MKNYNLIWISKNIKDKKYNDYIIEIDAFQKFQCFTPDSIDEGIDKIINIKFEECVIIVDSDIYKDFNEKFKKEIDELYLIPKIIVFNNKNNNEFKDYISKNKNYLYFTNEKLILENFESIKKELIINDVLKYFSNNDKFIFEQIKTKDDLGLLINYHKSITKPSDEEIYKFNKFLYETFKNIDSNLDFLLKQTFKYNVPLNIIIRYWLRMFSFIEFSEIINKDLEKRSGNNYDVYVKLLYSGLKDKLISPILNQNFYRGGKLLITEINEIKKNLDTTNKNLPKCICFSKVFLNFSLSNYIGMEIMKNCKLDENKEKLVFFEIIKGDEKIDSNNATNVEFDKVSFYPERKEVLFFPYSCFEVLEIKEINDNSNKKPYFHFKLIYLGKYTKLVGEKKIEEYKNITPNKFVLNIFSSKIYSKKTVETVIDNNPKLEPIKKEILENYGVQKVQIVVDYEVNNDNLKKNEQVINYNKDKNENDIKKKYIERIIGSQKEEFDSNKSFNYTFEQIGTIRITFSFLNELNNLSSLFQNCSNLININLSSFPMENVYDTSNMFLGCVMLEKIDLSNLNTKVSNTSNMFSGCTNLKNINLSNFTKNIIVESQNMFLNCKSLKDINFTNFKITGKNNFNMFPFHIKFNYNGVEKDSLLEKKIIEARK
jgi:hypothetical protein